MTLFSRTSNRRRRYLLRPHTLSPGGGFESPTALYEPFAEPNETVVAEPVVAGQSPVDCDSTTTEAVGEHSVCSVTPTVVADTVASPSEPLELVLTSPGIDGPERIRLDETTCIIGSGRQSDLRCPHAEVSRRHALLFRLQDRLLFADLASRTGVSLNGQRCKFGWFSSGDVLQFGPYSLRWPAGPQAETSREAVPSGNDLVRSATSDDASFDMVDASPPDLPRQFYERSRRQLDLLARAVDAVDGDLRAEMLEEMAALQQIVDRLEGVPASPIASTSSRQSLTNAANPEIDPAARRARAVRRAFGDRQRSVATRRPMSTDVPSAPVPQDGTAESAATSPVTIVPLAASASRPTADYGRIMQRMAIHQHKRSGPWKRLLRSLFLPG